MNSEETGVNAPSDENSVLAGLAGAMSRLHLSPGLGSWSFGVAEWDWQLWNLGREWLAAHPSNSSSLTSANDKPTDVYLATEIYDSGGHTPLIGDFVRALDNGASPGSASHLIVTNIRGSQSAPLAEAARARVALPQDHIHVLAGLSFQERLEQLFEKLRTLRPRRLFLFHHPEDPLACVAAQPEIATQRLFIHHADARASFGLHLPGIRLVDLHSTAAARSRFLGLAPALLPLTTPDPGPRPHGFLQRGKLVTATCGGQHKYDRPSAFDYPETVGVILRSTGGWHVHIGPLSEPMLQRIQQTLQRNTIPLDRFVHVPWTSSLCTTLWEQQCDVYFASFPVDGARVNVEVAASGTPYLGYSSRPDPRLSELAIGLAGSQFWHTWEELAATLTRLSDATVLQEQSRLIREGYEAHHHPSRFTDHLHDILAGGQGAHDPHQSLRDAHAPHSLLSALTKVMPQITPLTEIVSRGPSYEKDLHAALQEITRQRERIDFLQDQRKRLEEKVDSLQEKMRTLHAAQDRQQNGKTLRAKILRWLTRG